MTLGQMRALLDREGIRLTRSLGQSFLHDANQLRRIVALAQIEPGDRVLEIGPGLGPLTSQLLSAGARVLAIEKDQRLGRVLQRTLAEHPALQLRVEDALAWLKNEAPDLGEWKVVSNLPYSVGSPILVELAQLPRPPVAIIATLQAEVVNRLRAQTSTPEFGLLTLLIARVYEPKASFHIPPGSFFPPPNVDSACVRLEGRPSPLVSGDAAEAYKDLAKLAFSQRRKQLRKVLRSAWPADNIAAAWRDGGLPDDVRAEALPPEVFARLATLLGTPRAKE